MVGDRPSRRLDTQIVLLDATVPRRRTMAIGSFDGIHLGHRAVIAGADTVVTFHPHPRSVVGPESAPPLLTSLTERARRLAGLHVRELVVVPFDAGIAAMGPQEFVDAVLVEQLGAQRVRIGEDFRFGSRASGGPQLLRADRRFDTDVVPLLRRDGAPVSSSRIRQVLAAGAIEEANALLGEPHAIHGVVRAAADQRLVTLHAPGTAVPGTGRYTCRIDGTNAVVDVLRIAGGLVPAIPPTWAPLDGSPARIEFLTQARRSCAAHQHRDGRPARPATGDGSMVIHG